jgi:hypothetical protein
LDNGILKMRNQYIRKLFPNTEQRRYVLEEFAKFFICGGGFDEHDSIEDRGEMSQLIGGLCMMG